MSCGDCEHWAVNKTEEPCNSCLENSVNHPSHYNSGSIETIKVIEDWQLGFHLGNALKYISRAGKKDRHKEIEDLEKAKWYLDRYIKRLEELKGEK